MATLKSLLDATIKAGSKWSLPKGNSVTIGTLPVHADDSSSWADPFYWTATADGVVASYNVKAEDIYIKQTATGTDIEPLQGSERRRWSWVRKGQRITVYVFNYTATTALYFYPLLGQV